MNGSDEQGQGLLSGKGYKFSPAILLGKAFRTQQFAVTSTPIRIIFESQTKFFSIIVPSGENVYIGHQAVTTSSGFLLQADLASTFGVLENVQIFAVSANPTTLYLLDMGLY